MRDAGLETRGDLPPELKAAVPGPASTALVDALARVECPGITARRARQGEARGVGRDPIVWERAAGANVWDADGNRYVDLTGAFGVALVGHAHPRVVEAVREQAGRLLHGMGDVFPNEPRIRLMERLAALAPPGLERSILATSGSEAVEAALKTARLASGRPGVVAFWGAYHGLSYGALAATAYKADFRAPFADQLGRHVTHLPYGVDLGLLEGLVRGPATGGEQIGTVLVEPILGRGGQVVPPDEWLRDLRRICDDHSLVLVFDEVYTGLGRTGRWWAGDHAGVVPDVLCVGKALGGGMPVSACLARSEVMDAWGASRGEAIHTSTFLGHPVAAAAAVAALDVLQEIDAPARAGELERRVRARLGARVRGRGAMLGVETGGAGEAARAAGELLRRGYLVLPGGVQGDVLGLTPPLVLSEAQLDGALDALESVLGPREPVGHFRFGVSRRLSAGSSPGDLCGIRRVSLGSPNATRSGAAPAPRAGRACDRREQEDPARHPPGSPRTSNARQAPGAGVREALLADLRRFVDEHDLESSGAGTRSSGAGPVSFEALAERVVRFQIERVPAYGRLVGARGGFEGGWRRAPLVPTDVFRDVDLSTGPPFEAVFRTSGSTSGRRGERCVPDLGLYDRAMEGPFVRWVLAGDRAPRPWLVLVPKAPDSSLSHMLEVLAGRLARPGAVAWAFTPEGLDLAAAAAALATEEPIVVLATAFAIVQLLDGLPDLEVRLPAGSRMMLTGGFKGRSREVPEESLLADLASRLGLEPAAVVPEYGMTELTSQAYGRPLEAPPWLRLRVVDPATLADLAPGEEGLVAAFDLLNLDNVSAVLTGDLGVLDARGRLELRGRAPGAVLRGCSLTAEELGVLYR